MLDVHSKHISTSKIVSRNVGEVKLAIEHLNNLNKRFDLTKLIVIYDRGYGSTQLMLHTMYLDSKFIIRLNGHVFKKKIQQMSSDDEIIKINIKNYILKKIEDEKVKEFAVKMERLEFRVVKVKLKNGDIEVLATNLDEKEFSKNNLKELYGKRWTIETGYDKLVRHDGSVAHLISEILLNIDFNPSCDGISSLETLNQVIGYEVA